MDAKAAEPSNTSRRLALQDSLAQNVGQILQMLARILWNSNFILNPLSTSVGKAGQLINPRSTLRFSFFNVVRALRKTMGSITFATSSPTAVRMHNFTVDSEGNAFVLRSPFGERSSSLTKSATAR